MAEAASQEIGPSFKRLKLSSDCCAVEGCDYNLKQRYHKTGIQCHFFPKNEFRCTEWIEFCQNPCLNQMTPNEVSGSGYYICSQHFSDSADCTVGQKKTLLPTLRPLGVQNSKETSQFQPSTPTEDIPTREIDSNPKRVKTMNDCAVLECDFNRDRPYHKTGVKCHNFPTDEALCAEWREFCQNPHLKEKDPLVLQEDFFICSQHFAESDYKVVVKRRVPYPTVMPIQRSKSVDIFDSNRKKTTKDCAVLACDYNKEKKKNQKKKKTGIQHFSFPNEESTRLDRWIRFCLNPQLKNKTPKQLHKSYFICSQHFSLVQEKTPLRPSLRSIPASQEPCSGPIQPSTSTPAEDIPILDITSDQESQHFPLVVDRRAVLPPLRTIQASEELCLDKNGEETSQVQPSTTAEDISIPDITTGHESQCSDVDFEVDKEINLITTPEQIAAVCSTGGPEKIPSKKIACAFKPKRAKLYTDCAVLECDYNRYQPYHKTGIKCHNFPTDEALCAEWREYCQNPHLKDKNPMVLQKSFFICSQHFAESDYEFVGWKYDALPTLMPRLPGPISAYLDPDRVKTKDDCAVLQCDYNKKKFYYKTGITHHFFPKDILRRVKWKNFCQNPRLNQMSAFDLCRKYFICSQHFLAFADMKAIRPSLRTISAAQEQCLSSNGEETSQVQPTTPAEDIPRETSASYLESLDCAFLECDYNRSKPYHKTGIKCHNFPTDEALCAEWIEFCQNPLLKDKTYSTLQGSYFICSQHFDESDFIAAKMKSLIPTLMPCLLEQTSADSNKVKTSNDCAVLACDYNKKKTYYRAGIKHYSFPIETSRCDKWIEFCQNPLLKDKTPIELSKSYFICSQHFSAVPEWKALRPSRSFAAAQGPSSVQNSEEPSAVQPSTPTENIITPDLTSQCSEDDDYEMVQDKTTSTSEPNATTVRWTEGLGDIPNQRKVSVPNPIRSKLSSDCAVLECDYNKNKPYYKTGIKRHFFPTDETLCAEWKEFCQNPCLNDKTGLQKTYFICSQHFAESDLIVVKKRSSRPTLRPSGQETRPDSKSLKCAYDCAVLECDYNRKQPNNKTGIKCHCFPRNESLSAEWIEFCRNPRLKEKTPMQLHKSYFICSQHFSFVTEKRGIRPSLRTIPAAQDQCLGQNGFDRRRVKPYNDCAVLECDYNREQPYYKSGISCYSFPLHNSLCDKWTEFCQDPLLKEKAQKTLQKSYFICSQHFAESDFIVTEKKSFNPTLMPCLPSSTDISPSFDSSREKTEMDCAVLACDYNKEKPYHRTGITHHSFPLKAPRFGKWIQFCKNPNLKDKTRKALHESYFICSQHFSIVQEKRPLCPSLRPIPAALEPCSGPNSQVQPSEAAENIPSQNIASNPDSESLCPENDCEMEDEKPLLSTPEPIAAACLTGQPEVSTSQDSSVSKPSREKFSNDCAVLECDYNRKRPYHKTGIKHRYFPKDELLCAEWIDFCQNPDLKEKAYLALQKSYFICSQHFDDSDFIMTKRGAVCPTLRPTSTVPEPSLLGPNCEETGPVRLSTSTEDIPIQTISFDLEREKTCNDCSVLECDFNRIQPYHKSGIKCYFFPRYELICAVWIEFCQNPHLNGKTPLLLQTDYFICSQHFAESGYAVTKTRALIPTVMPSLPVPMSSDISNRVKTSLDCAVLGCDYNSNKTYHKTGIQHHYFPLKKSRCDKWIKFCQNPHLKDKTPLELCKNYFVCSQHFSVVLQKRPLRPSLRTIPVAQEPCLGPNGKETSQVQPSTTEEDIPSQNITLIPDSESFDNDCEMEEEKPLLSTSEPVAAEGLGDTPNRASDSMRGNNKFDCAVLECDYNRKHPYHKAGIKHRYFPKDELMCAEWIEFCQNPCLKDKTQLLLHRNYFICSQHFDDSDFIVTKKGGVCPTLRQTSTAQEPFLLVESVETGPDQLSASTENIPIQEIAIEADSEPEEDIVSKDITSNQESQCSDNDFEMDEEKPLLSTSEPVAAEGLGDTPNIASDSMRENNRFDCAVLECDYNRKLPYYKAGIKNRFFPKDELMCAEWKEFCQNPLLNDKTPMQLHKNFFICSQHFDDSDFIVTKRGAVCPTLRPTSADQGPCLLGSNGEDNSQVQPNTGAENVIGTVESLPKRVKTSFCCSVLECDYNRKKRYHKTGIKHHNFPKNDSLCAEWLEFCRDPHLKDKTPLLLHEKYFICSQHFAESDYELVERRVQYPTELPNQPSTSAVNFKRPKVAAYCAVLNCDYNRSRPYHKTGIRCHFFPSNKALCAKWLEFCQDPRLKDKTPMQLQKSSFICSQHFSVVPDRRPLRPSLRKPQTVSKPKRLKYSTDCSVLECDYNQKRPYYKAGIKRRFFPIDQALCAEWIEFCQNPQLKGKTPMVLQKSFFICSQHFSFFAHGKTVRPTLRPISAAQEPCLLGPNGEKTSPAQPSTTVENIPVPNSNPERVKSTYYCAVLECDYKHKQPYHKTDIKIHYFPTNEALSAKWKEFCQNPRLKDKTPRQLQGSYFICNQHFLIIAGKRDLCPTLKPISTAQEPSLSANDKETSQDQISAPAEDIPIQDITSDQLPSLALRPIQAAQMPSLLGSNCEEIQPSTPEEDIPSSNRVKNRFDCSVLECDYNRKRPYYKTGIKHRFFPSDESTCAEWRDFCQNPGLEFKTLWSLHRDYFICSQHFDESDFIVGRRGPVCPTFRPMSANQAPCFDPNDKEISPVQPSTSTPAEDILSKDITSDHESQYSDVDYGMDEEKTLIASPEPISSAGLTRDPEETTSQDRACVPKPKRSKSTSDCSVLECDYNQNRPKTGIGSHYFPTDKALCAKWIEFCQNPHLKEKDPLVLQTNYFICSQHFDESDFIVGQKGAVCPTLRPICSKTQESSLLGLNGGETSQISTTAENVPRQNSTDESQSKRVKTRDDCSVLECDYNRRKPYHKTGIKHHNFPFNEKLCAEWLEFCRDPHLKDKTRSVLNIHYFICSQHFNESDYELVEKRRVPYPTEMQIQPSTSAVNFKRKKTALDCAVLACDYNKKKTYYKTGIRHFSFPNKKSTRFYKWIKFCKNPWLKNKTPLELCKSYFICSQHFSFVKERRPLRPSLRSILASQEPSLDRNGEETSQDQPSEAAENIPRQNSTDDTQPKRVKNRFCCSVLECDYNRRKPYHKTGIKHHNFPYNVKLFTEWLEFCRDPHLKDKTPLLLYKHYFICSQHFAESDYELVERRVQYPTELTIQPSTSAVNFKRVKTLLDCAVLTCDYNRKKPYHKTGIKHHCFPRNKSSCDKWIKFCQNPNLKDRNPSSLHSSYFICSQHFLIVTEKKAIRPSLRTTQAAQEPCLDESGEETSSVQPSTSAKDIPIQDITSNRESGYSDNNYKIDVEKNLITSPEPENTASNVSKPKRPKDNFDCCVLECDYNQNRPKTGIGCHYFPTDETLCAKWIEFCQNPHLKEKDPLVLQECYFICSQHFDESDFIVGQKGAVCPTLRPICSKTQDSSLLGPNGGETSQVQPNTTALENIPKQNSTDRSQSKRVKTRFDCSVMECDYNRKKPYHKTGIKHHYFPINKSLCAEWIEFSQNPYLKDRTPTELHRGFFICSQHFLVETDKRPIRPSLRTIPAVQDPFLVLNGRESIQVQPSTSTSAEDIPILDITSDPESSESDFVGHNILAPSITVPAVSKGSKGNKNGPAKTHPSTASEQNPPSILEDNVGLDLVRELDTEIFLKITAIELSKIYANPELNRKCANETIDLMVKIRSSVEQNNVLEAIGHFINTFCLADVALNLKNELKMMTDPWHNLLSTEEKRMDLYKQMGTLPEIFRLNPDFATLNIECIVRNFLQMPGVLDSIEKEQSSKKKTSDAVFNSFMKGDIWQEKESKFDKNFLTIPLALYFVSIGSNFAVFLTFPSLPNSLLSKEENHFLVGLIGGDCATIDTFLQKLVTDLRSLLRGLITMEVNGQIRRVQFCLAFALGTKDGLQQFLGLKQDCLFCSENVDTKPVIPSREFTARDFSCENFELHRDVIPDFSEDWLLKICIWNLNLVFVEVIPEKVSLSVANERLRMFKVHSPEKQDLAAHGLEGVGCWLESLTEEEVQRLVCFLPFVFADHIPPETNSRWTLFMELQDIVFALLGSIGKKDIPKLSIKIVTYLTQCKEFFPDGSLPNYFHAAFHYPNAYEKFGPFGQFLTIRRGVDKICQHLQKLPVDLDKDNLVEAYSWKQQMVVNERFLSKRGTSPESEIGPELPLSPALVKQFDLAGKYQMEGLKRVKYFTWQGEKFLPNSIVISGYSEEHLQFAQIQHILSSTAGDICLCLCFRFKTLCFDKHYGSYRVVDTEEPEIVDLLQIEWKCPVQQIFTQDGSNFILLNKTYQ